MNCRCPRRPGLAGCDEFMPMTLTADAPTLDPSFIEAQAIKEKKAADTLAKLAPLLIALLLRG